MEAEVNNAFYDELGNEWYARYDHPIALLRAENQARTPWVNENVGKEPKKILDVGCGAGFLANALAEAGHRVIGVDQSAESLAVAHQKDRTQSVTYQEGDAYALPFEDGTFDVVCSMDFLEHVEDPKRAVGEAARVLKPGGKFFFHTFNRHPFCYLFALKGVEWFVPNTPKDMHIYRLFVKPSELRDYCSDFQMRVEEMHGLMPVWNKAFWTLLFRRKITPEFCFERTKSLKCGYMGYALKD